MHNSPDFVAIGDITTDAFIRLDDAEVKECVDHHRQELCLSFGDKVPYEFVKIVRGVGNSANAAVAAARLGLRSSLMANVGGDVNGKECLQALSDNKVSVGLMSVHKKLETNYHYVLWYDVERTILVKHQHYPYSLPTMKTPPAWMYLSSLGENSLEFHMEILSYLSKHRETKLVFQPGTYQMKFGVRQLKGLYEQTEVFFCNVEEAQRILKTEEADIKKLLKGMSDLGPRFVFITDGIKGAYAYDRKDMWFMPVYPQEPYERTGAGDAFSSTVTVALAKGKSIEEALLWGPVNSASVVQYIGAQEGLLTEEKLQQFLEKAPANYKPVKI
jgi:ribokinase